MTSDKTNPTATPWHQTLKDAIKDGIHGDRDAAEILQSPNPVTFITRAKDRIGRICLGAGRLKNDLRFHQGAGLVVLGVDVLMTYANPAVFVPADAGVILAACWIAGGPNGESWVQKLARALAKKTDSNEQEQPTSPLIVRHPDGYTIEMPPIPTAPGNVPALLASLGDDTSRLFPSNAAALVAALEELRIKVHSVPSAEQCTWGDEIDLILDRSIPGDIIKVSGQLEGRLHARPDSILVAQNPNNRARCTVRILRRDPFDGMPASPYRAPLSASIHDKHVLGRCMTGEDLTLRFLRINAVLVGVSRSGKSTAMLDIADTLSACRDVVQWDIDLGSHGAGLEPVRDVLSRRATNAKDAEAMLKDALAIAKIRPSLFSKLGMGRNWEPSAKYPALVIHIDEFPALVSAGLWSLVSQIQLTGLKSAVQVVIGSQGITRKYVGDVDLTGAALKVMLACSQDDTVRLLNGGAIDNGWLPHKLHPASGSDPRDASKAYIEGAGCVDPVLYRFFWLPDNEAERRSAERLRAGLPRLDADSLIAAGVMLDSTGRGLSLAEQLAGRGEDGQVLATLLDVFRDRGEEWLPTSELRHSLERAGSAVTDRRLQMLLGAEGKDRRPWPGATGYLNGYTRDAVESAARNLLSGRSV